MSDEIVENLKKPSAWFRVLFMAGFVVAVYVTGVVLFVIMLAQILFSLISGSDNVNLRRLGAGLASYVAQILAFLTYNSEEKPFPFAPFPLPGYDTDASGGPDVAENADSADHADVNPPSATEASEQTEAAGTEAVTPAEESVELTTKPVKRSRAASSTKKSAKTRSSTRKTDVTKDDD